MKTRFFTPPFTRQGHKCLLSSVLFLSLTALSGCITAEKSSSPALAPAPPLLSPEINGLSFDTPESNYKPAKSHGINTANVIKSEETKLGNSQINCSLKDRLDRQYLLAYEWGRSKLSLDIDGVNLKNSGDKAFRIEYKIRLQPEKTKKQLCRYPSNWQGLIGSSYNEFIIKEAKISLHDIIKLPQNTID